MPSKACSMLLIVVVVNVLNNDCARFSSRAMAGREEAPREEAPPATYAVGPCRASDGLRFPVSVSVSTHRSLFVEVRVDSTQAYDS